MIGDNDMDNLMDKLARLDVSEEAAHLEGLKQQAAELTAASQRGHARMLEIAREIEALKAGRGDGEAAAEALLGGENVALAAPQQEALEQEREAIKAGMANLAEREREISHRRAGVIEIVESKSAAAFEDQVADLERRAKTLAGELATVMADADAIGYGAANSHAIRLAASLRDGVAGLRRMDALVPLKVAVSPDIVAALTASPARPLLRRHIPSTVNTI